MSDWKFPVRVSEDGTPIDFINAMSVLSLKPDDIIVIKSPFLWVQAAKENFALSLLKNNIHNRVIIMDGGMDIGVMRPDA